MSEDGNTGDVHLAGFREVVRHPRAHAVVLQQHRIGERAGVVALKRLLAEMRPEGNLHRAMEIHHRDEERHSRVFTDWIARLGIAPEPMPAEVEAYFANDPEELRRNREAVERAARGDNGAFVSLALEQARARFAEFSDTKRRESRAALERVLGGGRTTA